jgi:DNA-binding GntR family transcriptional regulator
MEEGSVPEFSALSDRRTTSDAITDFLRDAILTGSFGDGEELNHSTLAMHFGVSRVPIREALRQLQAEGLVTSRAHRRTVVTALSVDRVVELLDLRRLLEIRLLRLSAPHLDHNAITNLRDLCTDMNTPRNHADWLELNRVFHRRLCGQSDATYTMELAESLARRVERYLRLDTRGNPLERTWEANEEHHTIVDLVSLGKVDAACAALDTHIGRTREKVIALLDRGRADPAGTLAEC